jgi:hypothetical protein
MRFSSANRNRLVSVEKIAAFFGKDLNYESLLCLHAYMGCDTVSAFSGMGKTKGIKLIRQSRDFQDAFAKLGSDWVLGTEVMNVLQIFTISRC